MDIPPIWTQEKQKQKKLYREVANMSLLLSCNLLILPSDNLKKIQKEHVRLSNLIMKEKTRLLKLIKDFVEAKYKIDREYTIDDSLEDIRKGYGYIVKDARIKYIKIIKGYQELGYKSTTPLNSSVFKLSNEIYRLKEVQEAHKKKLDNIESDYHIWKAILEDPDLKEDRSNIESIARKYIK